MKCRQFTETHVIVVDEYGQPCMIPRESLVKLLFDELQMEKEELMDQKARLEKEWRDGDEIILEDEYEKLKHRINTNLVKTKEQSKMATEIWHLEEIKK